MKKCILFTLLMLTTAGLLFAQETATTEPLKNKKGVLILPQTGNWGLGIAANPFLDYLGNFMNNSGNTSPDFDFAGNLSNNVALFGKYVKNENTYYRGRFNINIQSTVEKQLSVANPTTPPSPTPVFVEDLERVGSQAVVLAAGIEKRKGGNNYRLQGIYGAELIIGFSGSNTKYEYGNGFSATVPAPASADFGSNIIGASRVTESKGSRSFLVGARGFVGVEYFFAPRISLSGEFGYILSFNPTGKTVVTTEAWTGTAVRATETESFPLNPPPVFRLGLDNLDGAISLLFYF